LPGEEGVRKGNAGLPLQLRTLLASLPPSVLQSAGLSLRISPALYSLIFAHRVARKPLERHPLGSQAFYPLQDRHCLIVVAEAGAAPSIDTLRAFRATGRPDAAACASRTVG
jgi:hypothetical protein